MNVDISFEELKVMYSILDRAEERYPGLIEKILKKDDGYIREDTRIKEEVEDEPQDDFEDCDNKDWLSAISKVKNICDLD